MTYRGGYEHSARFYDLFDQKQNIDFFLRYALAAGDVLDVGAGTGRIAIPLARHGVRIHCIEPSPAMREEFDRKLRMEPHLGERITLSAGTARSFHCDRHFPVCLLSGVFDHLLDHRERTASLRNIAGHLQPSGLLVFDVFLGLMAESPLKPAGEAFSEGRRIRRLVGGQLLPGHRRETRLVFEVYERDRLADRIEERSLVGVIDRSVIHRTLAETAFEVRREWSGYDGTPYREGDPLLVLEATKRAGA